MGEQQEAAAPQGQVSWETRGTAEQAGLCCHQQGHSPATPAQSEQGRDDGSDRGQPQPWITEQVCGDEDGTRSSEGSAASRPESEAQAQHVR